MDRLFGRLWTGMPLEAGEEGLWAPALDVSETDEALRVQVELPGLEAKDVDVSVHDNLLTISGERKGEQEEKGRNWHRVERRYGRFERTLALPAEVDAEKVSADYQKGVLTVVLPKSPASQVRKVSIEEKK
jgi:HSP20 family protein